MTRKLAALTVLWLVAGAAGRAEAGLLLGTQVTGSLVINGQTTNLFDPASGIVPDGYLNKTSGTTVTISDPDIEFGIRDGVGRTVESDFTDSILTITHIDPTGFGFFGFTFTFTNAAFVGLTVDKTSDAIPGGISSFSLVGDTLTIITPQFSGVGTFSAVFSFTPTVSAVPEPSTLISGGLAGAVGLGLVWRRRRARTAGAA